MNTYIYHGSLSADTINGIDYVFVNNKEYKLPEGNRKIEKMLRQGTLCLKCPSESRDTKLDAVALKKEKTERSKK